MANGEVDEETGLRAEWSDGEILILTLNRPESLNAINLEMREAWVAALRAVESQARSCRAVIITGAGRALSAGGDVAEMDEFFGQGADAAAHEMLRFQEMCRLVVRLPAPVISAVNGLALGGGTAVSLMSDLRVASEDAVFGVGQVKAGIVPDVGLTYLLPRIVGLTRALEMMLLDRRIDAQTALLWGLVNAVVPADEVLPTALAWARQMASMSEPALRWTKRAAYLNLDSSLDHALNLEAMAEGLLVGTPEFLEAKDRFLKER